MTSSNGIESLRGMPPPREMTFGLERCFTEALRDDPVRLADSVLI
jgi:hypothetical protein